MMETRVVAKVIVLNQAGQVLLLRRSETDVRRPLQWDIPGGHTDDGEFAEEAAARESMEEAGVPIDVRKLQLVYSESQFKEPDLNVVWVFYVARTAQTEVKLSSEHSEFRWAELSEVDGLLEYDRHKRAFEYVITNKLV